MYEWADCDHLNLISLETISNRGPPESWKIRKTLWNVTNGYRV